jgi:DNA-binding NarL/FixJ family response regulator
MLRIVIADDHQVVREGLRTALSGQAEMWVVAETGDGLEAVALVERERPDVLVVDLKMPGLSGIEVTRQVTRRFQGTRVVFVSAYSAEGYVVEALKAGASAYVLKEAGTQEILKAIREALKGNRYLSSPLSERAIQVYLDRLVEVGDPYLTLTDREREVLYLTAEALSLQEIADRLFISTRTVESHRSSIARKLGLRNRAEVIRYALQRGIIPGDP